MGCGSAKQTLEDAIDELKVNPATGLVNLHIALRQAGKDSRQESVKAKVPHIFELLPKAMEGLSGNVAEAVLAACSVIECCANICNDPSLIGAPVVMAGETIKQCQSRLVTLLNKSKMWYQFDEVQYDKLMCENSSKVAKAVALATVALLRLEAHAKECKQELVRLGGIAFALKLMQTENSVVAIEAKESLALMLSLFADTPESVAIVIAHGGTFVLVPYVEEPEVYDVPKDMYNYCVIVLEACLAHGQSIRNKHQVQAAIDKGAFRRPWTQSPNH